MIIWRDEYNIGIETIDNQHIKLVDLINRLYDAFINKKQSEEVILVLSELREYTKSHFRTEENYFLRFQYSDRENHIKEHKKFIDTINAFSDQIADDPGRFVFSIIKFLQDWILNHISISDKKYVPIFQENNVY